MGNIKRIAILGSTGSIGRQTLEVVRSFPGKLRVVGLAGGRNLTLLQKQLEEFQPRLFFCLDPDFNPSGAERVSLEEMAAHPDVDLVMVATSGSVGLNPTLAALRAGKEVALANKEVLVAAGELLTAEARERGITFRPVDSEHSAIWQCLQGEEEKEIGEVILTASGGPFRNLTWEEMTHITPAEALRHPTWKMGRKVTIDSATLFNKGMEVIEAHWLFGLDFDHIEVIIHPQAIIHSLVRFVDGSLKAQLAPPDMRLPIQYALSYPERWENPRFPQLDLERLARLEFEPVDLDRFPCLRLALQAGREGGTYPAVLSAADERAVELFLSGQIGFLDIPELISRVLEQHKGKAHPQLEEILEIEPWVEEKVSEFLRSREGVR